MDKGNHGMIYKGSKASVKEAARRMSKLENENVWFGMDENRSLSEYKRIREAFVQQ